MNKIIDIHCHLLPGLDDGIESLEEAIQACALAEKEGIQGIVATPHMREGFFDVSPSEVMNSLSVLQDRLTERNISIELFPGAEVHISDHLPEKVRNGSVLTLNDTKKYLLLELSYQQYPMEFEKLLFSLKVSGITPVLAHPERVKYFKDDMERILRAVQLGALTQVTSSSILGHFGEDIRKYSLKLAERGLLHIIASDSHDTNYRPPALMEASAEMAKKVGERAAKAMIRDYPSAIVSGEELKIPYEVGGENVEKKKGRLSFLQHFYKKK